MLLIGRVRRALIISCIALLPGCVRASPKAPPLKEVELAGGRAAFRAYGPGTMSICDAEPRWLAEELASVNALVRRFLAVTENGPGVDWSQDDLRVLRQSLEILPELLEAHGRNLAAVRKCAFRKQSYFVDVLKTGDEQNRAAALRLGPAKKLLAYVEASIALRRWRNEAHEEQQRLASYCEPEATIYFAKASEDGDITYFFCDETEVTLSDSGKPPEVVKPPRLSGRRLRAWKEGPYLKRAKSYPTADIRTPPPLPPEPDVSTAAR